MNTILTIEPPAILKAPAWDKNQGPAPFVYSAMPAGHRALWTCNWTVSALPDSRYTSRQAYLVKQQDWGPCLTVTNMSREAIRAELEDIAARSGFWNWQAMQLLLNTDNDEGHYLYMVEDLISKAREGYPEFVATWNQPAELHQRTLRPGWENVIEGATPGRVVGLRLGRR